MNREAIDQAFFEMYRGSISECDDETILRFLKDNNSVDSMEGYTHLMDTYIAFESGINYQKKQNTPIHITKSQMLEQVVDYEVNWILERDESTKRQCLKEILLNGSKGFKNLSKEELFSQCVDIGLFLMEE
jgi:hypothetical protein